jgi:hypothetical protein
MTTPTQYPEVDPDIDPDIDRAMNDDGLDQEGYYLVIPDEVVQSAAQRGTAPYPAEDYAEDYDENLDDRDFDDDLDEDDNVDVLEPERKPMSRNAVSMIGGVATSVVAGVIPSLFVAPPASLASGLAAGVFGGLMGASLANEFYDRRHKD